MTLGLEDILAANLPDRTGGIDLRRFEWHFWKRQLRSSHRVLKGHEGGVHDLEYTPDGRHLATAGFDGTIRVWDISTGDPVRIFRPGPPTMTSVAFSPDGTCLAASQGTGTYLDKDSGVVILWDWRANRELRRLEGQAGGVHSVAFSHDGRRLAAAGYGGAADLGRGDGQGPARPRSSRRRGLGRRVQQSRRPHHRHRPRVGGDQPVGRDHGPAPEDAHRPSRGRDMRRFQPRWEPAREFQPRFLGGSGTSLPGRPCGC